jgi:hypothetical protein
VKLIILISIIISSSTFAQKKKYLNAYTQREIVEYEEQKVDESRIRLSSLDENAICGGIILDLNKQLKRKSRPEIRQDSSLNGLCQAILENHSHKNFRKGERWRKEKKSVDIALGQLGSQHRLFELFLLKVDVLDHPQTQRFFLDKNNDESSTHLYAGNKPTKKDRGVSGFEEPAPIEAKNLIQLKDAFMEQFKGRRGIESLLSKKFQRIGLAIDLEEKSIDVNARPYLHILVILTGKQNQYLKKKDKLERLTKWENQPYGSRKSKTPL